MKKLFANIGGKVASLADDIASYNDPTRFVATSKPSGPAMATSGAPLSSGLEGPLDPVLEHLLRNVRSRHVRQHFARTDPAEYTRRQAVTIEVATFNVAGKKPPPGLKLDEWLGAGPVRVSNTGPEILALGFVELVPLNAGNVMGVWGSANVDAWDRCLAVYLNGEEWATQRYGPPAPAPVGQAAAAAAAATLLETKWQGGGAEATTGVLYGSPGRTTDSSLDGSAGAASTSGGVDEMYVQVASKQLVGMYLSVWVRRRLLPEIRGVQATAVATGFGGYLGNKGAVAARMRLYDSSLVFVASHLTAGEAEGDELRRNADVHDILRRAVFTGAPDGGGSVAMTSAPAALISASLGPGHWPPTPSAITDHDLVIWVGDLNYRISTVPTTVPTAALAAAGASAGAGGEARPVGQQGLTDADVRAAIRAGRLEPLLAVDQLNRERAAGRVFQGWHEGRLTFPPTYKFKVGTHTYNGDELPASSSAGSLASTATGTAGDATPTAADDGDSAAVAGSGSTAADSERHKRRTPAWCDRVLWWTRSHSHEQQHDQQELQHPQQHHPPHKAVHGGGGGGAVAAPRLRQLAYWRGELIVSDHKPVAAAFLADVVSYDRRRIEGVLEAGMRAVDLMQQSLRPRVTVEPVVLDAGEWVALGRPVKMRVQLINTGTVEAIFHFVPPPKQPPPGHRGQGSKFGLDDETPPLPPWLIAQPVEGIVPPGQTCELVLTALVEGGVGGAAGQLSDEEGSSQTSTHGSLESIIILRIEDSGDKFISIGGRYRRSFLGMSLESLSRLGSRPTLPPAEVAALAGHLGLVELQQRLQLEDDVPSASDIADDGTVAPPKELQALVSALLADSAAALRMPGILADSAALVLARSGYDDAIATAASEQAGAADGSEEAATAALQPTSPEAQRALLRHLEPLRLVLDAGGPVPPGTNSHDIAAMLLLWCGQLPYPLIPAAVADAAANTPPTSPVDSTALLRRHCSPLQLAVVSELLRLLRSALEPAALDSNGLTAVRLAAAAAAWWMPPLPAGAAVGAATGQRMLLTMLLSGGDGTKGGGAAALLAD